MTVDWISMQYAVADTDLGPMLLDGLLQPSTRFSAEDRVLAVRFRVPQFAAHQGLPLESEWCITLRDVESLRVALFHQRPGPMKHGKPNGIELSASWDELALELSKLGTRPDASPVYVAGARMAVVGDQAALHLELAIDRPNPFAQLWARAASLSIEDDRGNVLSAEAFVAVGRPYWDDWKIMYGRG